MSESGQPPPTPLSPAPWRTGGNRFQALVHDNADGILVVSKEGDILYSNPAAEKLLGRSHDDLLGRAFGIPVQPGTTTEIEIPRLGQQSLRAEMRSLPTEWGETEARVAVLRDVTEQQRSRLAINFLSEVGRVLAGTLDQPTTRANILQLAVQELSDWCLLDHFDDDIVHRSAVFADWDTGAAQPIRSLCGTFPRPAEWGAEVTELLRQTRGRWLTDPAPAVRLDLALTPSQLTTLRVLNSHALMHVPLIARGKILGVLTLARTQAGMFYDRYDLAQTEAFAERAALALDNAKLYEGTLAAIRQRDEFLALLAHELRNPLTAILHSAQLWQRQSSGSTAGLPANLNRLDGVSSPAALIEQQSVHMARLLDDLLDLARITRGKMELRHGSLDLRELVERVANVVRAQFAGQQQSLNLQLGKGPAWVNGDAERLEQVLSNLLSNASKFTPAGGAILVELARAESQVVVRVQDSGRGLDATDLERIFEPFVQLDRTPDRARGGLGLGLTLSRDLLALHGGTLSASSPGKGLGSCFAFSLPWVAPPAPKEPEVPLATAPGVRIVLVEDSPQIRAVMSELLRFCGHQVDLAVDGEHGLQRIQELLPDVVLIDIDMPKLNGYQVATAVRANSDCDAVRLIAVSGYGQSHDTLRAKESGFDAHLTKPVRLESLQRMIRDVMQ